MLSPWRAFDWARAVLGTPAGVRAALDTCWEDLHLRLSPCTKLVTDQSQELGAIRQQGLDPEQYTRIDLKLLRDGGPRWLFFPLPRELPDGHIVCFRGSWGMLEPSVSASMPQSNPFPKEGGMSHLSEEPAWAVAECAEAELSDERRLSRPAGP